MRITLFDYGAGNLHSLAKALPGADRVVQLETDPTKSIDTDVLVLPGVGAFGSASQALAPGRDAMRAALAGGLPCLGICLGMQLLFNESDEGAGAGLGAIPGRVERIRGERVPQIGWNTIDDAPDALFQASGLEIAYYANSYVCRPTDTAVVIGWSTHESDRFAAAVRFGATVGVQFHPEKSSAPGLRFIEEFLRQC